MIPLKIQRGDIVRSDIGRGRVYDVWLDRHWSNPPVWLAALDMLEIAPDGVRYATAIRTVTELSLAS